MTHQQIADQAQHTHQILSLAASMTNMDDEALLACLGNNPLQFVSTLGECRRTMTFLQDFLDDLDERIILAVRKATPESLQ